MAEKYGEVPPKFTKKWWEYFWDYYKWHVIITVVAVLIASVTIVQCATRPKYDMNVVYAGHMNYSEEEINKLKEIISERISDIDGNGENSALLSTLVFADNAGSEEYDYAIQTKLDLTFTDDCSFIYLMDKANVDAQMQKEVVDQIYDCTDSFIDSSSDKVVKAADGKGALKNAVAQQIPGVVTADHDRVLHGVCRIIEPVFRGSDGGIDLPGKGQTDDGCQHNRKH